MPRASDYINRNVRSGYCKICGKFCGEMLINGKCKKCYDKRRGILK